MGRRVTRADTRLRMEKLGRKDNVLYLGETNQNKPRAALQSTHAPDGSNTYWRVLDP